MEPEVSVNLPYTAAAEESRSKFSIRIFDRTGKRVDAFDCDDWRESFLWQFSNNDTGHVFKVRRNNDGSSATYGKDGNLIHESSKWEEGRDD